MSTAGSDDRKVISLRGDPIASRGEPHAGLIARLETLLEQARSGEICGIAFALDYQDGGYSWGCDGAINRAKVIGALEAVKAHIVNLLLEE